MKFSTILLLLFFTFHQSFSQKVASLNDTGNMPFELIKEKIIIPVQINGNTYRFLVDTGGIFEISEDLQNEFGFNQTTSTTITDINKIEVELESVIVPEIKLGNWTFKNKKAIVSNLHSRYPYSCFEMDGMIGRDFFDNVVLHFNYASKTFRLSEDLNVIKLKKENRTKLKLSSRGLPEIKLNLNGKMKFIEFDSGSGDFYSPKTSDVEKRARKEKDRILKFYGEFSFGVSMDGVKLTNRYLQKVESFQIANTRFLNFYSQFSKVSAPRIGAAILKYGKVTLDYKNGWFYFEPYTVEQHFEPFKTFGFDIAIEDNSYKVKWTLEDSDAHKQGMRSGNKVIEINGKSTNNIEEDCFGYLNGYAFENEEKIKVTFINSLGQEQTIQLINRIYE